MKPAIPRRHRHGQLGILEVLGERLAIRPVRLDPRPQRHPHAVADGVDRFEDVSQPWEDSLHAGNHAATEFLSEHARGDAARSSSGDSSRSRSASTSVCKQTVDYRNAALRRNRRCERMRIASLNRRPDRRSCDCAAPMHAMTAIASRTSTMHVRSLSPTASLDRAFATHVRSAARSTRRRSNTRVRDTFAPADILASQGGFHRMGRSPTCRVSRASSRQAREPTHLTQQRNRYAA